jgi:hypothetical protein
VAPAIITVALDLSDFDAKDKVELSKIEEV